MDHEALIFLHIPKTAGMTLNRIIEWQYNPFSIFTIDPHRIRATPERFKTFSEQRRRQFRVVRGHMFYGIHEFLPQGATDITMLRDPVARLLSAYSFILRRPLNPMHRKLKRRRVGPLVDRCFLNAPTARAVRNRRALFAKELIETVQAKAEAVPVTSLACGPCPGVI